MVGFLRYFLLLYLAITTTLGRVHWPCALNAFVLHIFLDKFTHSIQQSLIVIIINLNIIMTLNILIIFHRSLCYGSLLTSLLLFYPRAFFLLSLYFSLKVKFPYLKMRKLIHLYIFRYTYIHTHTHIYIYS